MSDQSLLETIERYWQARTAGDREAVLSFFAPGAIYEMHGANAFADPATVGPATAESAVDQLLEAFRFHGREQLAAVMDGRKVAMINRFQVAFRDNAPVTTQACDFWEFDGAGKVTSFKQFVDTDLVRRMLSGMA